MKRFVLSSKEFKSIREAERKVTGWEGSGTLKADTKLYEIKAVYDLKLRFVKRK